MQGLPPCRLHLLCCRAESRVPNQSLLPDFCQQATKSRLIVKRGAHARVFDGEARAGHATYRQVRGRIAAAVFDDSNRAFRQGTIEPSGEPFVDTEGSMHARVDGRTYEVAMLRTWTRLEPSSPLWRYAYNFSKAHFDKAHFIIVQSGQWGVAAAARAASP